MEVSQHQAQDQLVLTDPVQMANFDAVCYVYDSSDPNSFGFIASLRVPCPFYPVYLIARVSLVGQV